MAIINNIGAATDFVHIIYCKISLYHAFTNKNLSFTPQDAFDAMGYFHLALAAALVDEGSLQARYIIYMKLAEIHTNYLPDVELSQRYMDDARSLKRELVAHTDSSDTGEYPTHAAAEYADAKSISHSGDGSRSSNFSSRRSTLVGSDIMGTSHTGTAQKEAGTEVVPADYISEADIDSCNQEGTIGGQHPNSEIQLHTSHTDSSIFCTEF